MKNLGGKTFALKLDQCESVNCVFYEVVSFVSKHFAAIENISPSLQDRGLPTMVRNKWYRWDSSFSIGCIIETQ
jgi:hypothetical protein